MRRWYSADSDESDERDGSDESDAIYNMFNMFNIDANNEMHSGRSGLAEGCGGRSRLRCGGGRCVRHLPEVDVGCAESKHTRHTPADAGDSVSV